MHRRLTLFFPAKYFLTILIKFAGGVAQVTGVFSCSVLPRTTQSSSTLAQEQHPPLSCICAISGKRIWLKGTLTTGFKSLVNLLWKSFFNIIWVFLSSDERARDLLNEGELIIPSHYWKYKHNQVVIEQMKLILNKSEPDHSHFIVPFVALTTALLRGGLLSPGFTSCSTELSINLATLRESCKITLFAQTVSTD